MKYKSVAAPTQGVGLAKWPKKVTVPDQSMTLQEILERFTRNEALPIDNGGVYHESDDDLEKVAAMDLVDRAEFIEKQAQKQRDYQSQEKRKEDARREKVRLEEREKIALEERGKLNGSK